tara:strand:- start:128 stop:1114 length:987 start_codon:yes stop_codon:yes gene_type:complete
MHNKKIKKNQHYVPKSHLKRFTIGGEKSLLWTFDKDYGEFDKPTSSIKKICAEDYYYYQVTPDNEIDHEALEDSISEVETIGNNIIDKILASRFMPYVSISGVERGKLAFYIALLLFRGPSFRDGVAETYGGIVKNILHQVWDKSNPPDELQKLVQEKGLSNAINVDINSTVSLEHMVNLANLSAQEFLKKEWVLVNAPDGENFITGDVPVVFYPYKSGFGDIGPAHKSAEILYPISKSTALILSPSARPKEYIVIGQYSYSLLQEINKKVSKAALRYIYCSDRFEWLKGFNLSSGEGQRVLSSAGSKGINIVKNPWKRKTNKPIKQD